MAARMQDPQGPASNGGDKQIQATPQSAIVNFTRTGEDRTLRCIFAIKPDPENPDERENANH
jgi:hypothetical protein